MVNVSDFSQAAHEMKRALLAQARAECSEEIDALKYRVKTLERERDEARTELTRASAYEQEAIKNRQRVRQILNICAVPHEQLGAYEKLALITYPDQKPYHLEKNGVADDVHNIAAWGEAIGGAKNQISEVVKKLDAAMPGTRVEVDYGDRHQHVRVEIEPRVLDNPARFIRPEKAQERKNNGGDKRCPACGGYCKKKFAVTYECQDCGIDYDNDMKPIDHTSHTSAPESEKQEVKSKIARMLQVVEQPELREEPPAPVPFLRRPIACRCGIRTRWIGRADGSHCTWCEIEYRGVSA